MTETIRVDDIVYERATEMADELDVTISTAVTIMCLEGSLKE